MMTGKATESRKIRFYIDSGASEHLVSDKSLLSSVSTLKNPINIQVAKNGTSIFAYVSGEIRLSHTVMCEREYKQHEILLEDVLVTEGLRHNLLSVQQIEKRGGSLTFKNGKVEIRFNDVLAAVGFREKEMYVIEFDKIVSANVACKCDHTSDELWHRRMGHLGMSNVSKLPQCSSTNMKISGKLPFCQVCVEGRSTRKPYTGQRTPTTRPLQRVHSDVCGPMPVSTYNGMRYFVIFVDDYTHMTVTYLMKNKSDVFDRFREFHAMATSHFNTKMSRLRSDRGTEYTCGEMKKFCKENGIVMEVNPAHNPELNGTSERMNRTLLDKARSMLKDNRISESMWGEAVMTATYLTNRSPTRCLQDKTPYELWFNKKPNLKSIRVFGCKAMAHNEGQKKKFDCRSKTLMMVGYDESGYRLWDNESRKIVIARNVDFDEAPPEVMVNSSDVNSGESLNTKLIRKSSLSTPVKSPAKTPQSNSRVKQEEAASSSEEEFHGFSDQEEEPVVTPVTVRRQIPTVIRRNPVRQCRENLQPRALALSAINWIEDVPLNYSEVFERDDERKWLDAIDDELNSLEENETWKVVKKPEAKLLDTKWVFKVKDDLGSPRYKARLVVRGYQQREGIDFAETYSPVARMATIRTVLAVSLYKKHKIRHLDVTTAFLYGFLEEDVYIKAPDGVEIDDGKALKLKKSLYGLRQSPKCWNQRFDSFISGIGFTRSKADYCLYTLKDEESEVLLVLYVDDVLLSSNSDEKLEYVINSLSSEFKMKDLGVPKRFMGINITLEEGLLTLDQAHYTRKIIEKFGMEECHETKTPIEINLQLKRSDGEPTQEPYRELIGSLMYLAIGTRPDIAFAVSFLSRFQEGATDNHFKHAKRILRYLKGTQDLKLTYKCGQEPLEGWVDADFANDEDRKSTTGLVIMVFNCPVMWASKKQPIVALSTTEAEFIAASHAACELLWFRKVLKDCNIGLEGPTVLHEDNQGAIAMSKNPETRRTKHIDVKYNFIREKVENGDIQLCYVPTSEQKADILTKSLSRDKLEVLRAKLGMSGSIGDIHEHAQQSK